MDIATSNSGEDFILKIAGAITETDSESLRQSFEQAFTSPQKKVILNLNLVPFITSTGIGKIIVLFRKLKSQGRVLKIKGIHENLYSMFTSINLDKMLSI